MTIGRWTVLDHSEISQSGERKWLCQCSYGTVRYVLERSLRYGGSVSCGCFRGERSREELSHQLTGQRFGDLTALECVPQSTGNRGRLWKCQCSCGNTCEVLASLLATGKRTHCGCKTVRHYAFKDITGQKFHMLTALYPLEQRSSAGNLMWHCRCDCGNELDVNYNMLVYTNMRSCGCRKKEHNEELRTYLTHVDGTSIDMLKSEKLPRNNTTGVKGVYLYRGKYLAKIVFQKKQYTLGTYRTLEQAAEARHRAETVLRTQVTEFWQRWKARADLEPEWAAANPMRIHVQHSGSEMQVELTPEI